MTEAMIVEAVRAAGSADPQVSAAESVGAVSPVADPDAVSRFQAAMGVGGAQSAAPVDPIPFASEATAAWRSAQANNQGILHRIRALSEMNGRHNVSALDMLELQYEVMNLSFQESVVSKVADKASNAVQTLIKNQ